MIYATRIPCFSVWKGIKFFNSRCFHFGSILESAVQSRGPLDGVRVLDMTRILAGPFCTMLLGDLGAEVLKIENPGTKLIEAMGFPSIYCTCIRMGDDKVELYNGGDETRRWGPPFVNDESTYFFSVNRNKKSIAINIKKPEGSNLVRQLAAKSDVLVENYVSGKLAESGLDYDTLKNIAPHLIYCSITGYGPTGPYSSRAGYDVIAASLGGLLHITGPEDGEPCKVGVAMTDLSTGLYAYGSIVAGLLQRKETGKGQKIDCNLLSTQVSLLANVASNYLNSGIEAKRWGTSHESIVPYAAFKTLDGYLTVGAGSDKQFKVLCKLLGMESLCEDQQYLTNKDRVHNRKALISLLSKKFQAHATSHWLHLFEGSGIPYGPINNMEQVFSDPQVLHNKMIVEMSHKTAGSIKVPGPAVSFSESANKPRSAPPVFGQHTDEILLHILGMSDDDVKVLRNKKIIV